jgi:hypothetical protein
MTLLVAALLAAAYGVSAIHTVRARRRGSLIPVARTPLGALLGPIDAVVTIAAPLIVLVGIFTMRNAGKVVEWNHGDLHLVTIVERGSSNAGPAPGTIAPTANNGDSVLVAEWFLPNNAKPTSLRVILCRTKLCAQASRLISTVPPDRCGHSRKADKLACFGRLHIPRGYIVFGNGHQLAPDLLSVDLAPGTPLAQTVSLYPLIGSGPIKVNAAP